MTNFILFIVPTLVFTISAIMQLLRMKRTRSSVDVSIGFVGLMAVGIIMTFTLSLNTGASGWIIVERAISVVSSVSVLIAVICWRKKYEKTDV